MTIKEEDASNPKRVYPSYASIAINNIGAITCTSQGFTPSEYEQFNRGENEVNIRGNLYEKSNESSRGEGDREKKTLTFLLIKPSKNSIHRPLLHPIE